jgi:hypothetical protein
MALNPNSLITTGDTSCAVVYRVVDKDGSVCRSTPAVFVAAARGDGMDGASLNASGQWIRIPTLRHLLEGTVAQIEIYFGTVDLQLFYVIDNDETVAYIDVCPPLWFMTSSSMISLDTAIAAAGVGEDLYTTGNSLANDPPPQLQALIVWRNRVMGAFGNRVWFSQEFAEGVGIQWSSTLKFDWLEGTGDIQAIGMIDWNYCAVLKKDCIGVISGAGPDGTGHGNYIIQTLPGKVGTTNPKSVINGADGLYFQDDTTKRLLCLGPQLRALECAKGWFNTESATVMAALHFEANRQVWFALSTRKIVVIDYKHKTEDCPFGQVYLWNVSSFGKDIVGMDLVAGLPTLLFSDGKLASYVEAQAYDIDSAAVKAQILMEIETGEMQPFGLSGMGDISFVQMLGEWLSSHTLTLTTYPQFATSGTAVSRAFTAAPEQLGTRPPSCQRVQSIRCKLTETAPAVTYGKGFKFVGFAMEVQQRGRIQFLPVGNMV